MRVARQERLLRALLDRARGFFEGLLGKPISKVFSTGSDRWSTTPT